MPSISLMMVRNGLILLLGVYRNDGHEDHEGYVWGTLMFDIRPNVNLSIIIYRRTQKRQTEPDAPKR